MDHDNSLTSLSVTLYEFRDNEETIINAHTYGRWGEWLKKRRWISRWGKMDIGRKMNEQNCNNKTQTKTELEWHGDKDEREWDVAAAFTYGPPTATSLCVELSWNLMAHGDARVGKWRGNRRVEWVASSLSHYLRTWCIQHYYRWCAHLGCQQPTELTPTGRFKWTRPFRRNTKSGFYACAITFQTCSTTVRYTTRYRSVPILPVLFVICPYSYALSSEFLVSVGKCLF